MSTLLTSDPQTIPQSLFTDSSTASTTVGARIVTPDGRVYRYCQAGTVALVTGKLYQASPQIANHQNLTPVAASVGDTSLTVTLGATAATLNQYAGGYVVITITPGQGYQYLISGHPAANASASLVLNLSDPIVVALTTSSRIDLVYNPYMGVYLNPIAPTSVPVGVAPYTIGASNYGWLQTGGVANVLVDGTLVAGSLVAASDGVAGAVEPTATGIAPVGIAVTSVSTTEYGAIRLLLDQ